MQLGIATIAQRMQREGLHAAARELDGFGSAFTCANADTIFEREHEDFSIADFTPFAGPAPFDDGVDRRFDELFIDGDLQLDLADQIYGELASAIGFRVPFLTTEALHIHYGEAEHLDLGQRLLDGLESAGLDDSDDQLHENEP